MSLRHGWTFAEIDHMAWGIVHRTRARPIDMRDAHEVVLFGITEALYAATEPPTRRTLLHAGITAANREFTNDLRQHGLIGKRGYRPEPGPGFQRYWAHTDVAHFPEDQILEQMAVHQVLAVLQGRQRATAVAVATHRDLDAAADALGITRQALNDRLCRIRATFRKHWHQGETPPRGFDATPYNRRRRRQPLLNAA